MGTRAGGARRNIVAVVTSVAVALSNWARGYLAVSSTPPRNTPPQSLREGIGFAEAAERRWDTDDGLPSVVVQSFAETGDGHIWVGTEQGLASFDGRAFRVVIPTVAVPALAALGSTLWAGSHQGLVRFDDGIGTPLPSGEPVGVTAIAVDTASLVFARVDGTVVERPHDGRRERDWGRAEGMPSATIGSLAVGPSDFAVGTERGLRFIDRATGAVRVAEPPLDATSIGGLVVHGDAFIVTTFGFGAFRCTKSGCVRLALEGLPVRAHLGQPHVLRSGDVLIPSSSGLVHLVADRVVERREEFAGSQSRVVEDRNGTVWVGAGNDARLAGLRALSFRGIQTWLPGEDGRALLETFDGRVFFATNSRGLFLRDSRGIVRRVDLALEGLESLRVLADDPIAGDHGVLVAGIGGAVRFGQDETQTIVSTGLARNAKVRSVQRLADGRLLLGGQQGLLLQRGDDFEVAPNTPATWRIVSVTPVDDHRVWVVTTDSGVHRVDLRDFSVERITLPAGVDAVGRPVVTRAGALILPGDNGVCVFDGGTTPRACFGVEQGFAEKGHLSAIEDELGNVWLAHTGGVSTVSVAELLSAVAKGPPYPKPLSTLRTLTRVDGLPGVGCNGGDRNLTRLRDGRIAVACMGGFAVIDPERNRSDTQPPTVIVRSVEVDGIVHVDGAQRVFAESASRFTFTFSAPCLLGNSKGQRFSVKLEGFDPDWVPGDQTSMRAVYTNLPRGRALQFMVRASNNEGTWNDVPATFRFEIRPRWYELLTVRVAGVLCLCSAFVLAVRVRTKRLKAQARLLEGLVWERTRALEERGRALAEERDRISALEQRTKQIAEVGRQIAASLEVETIARSLREYVTGNFDAPSYAVGLVDEAAGVLRYASPYYDGREHAPYDRSLANKDQLAVWCVDNRAPVVIGDASTEAARFIRDYEAHANAGQEQGREVEQSIVYLPLVSGDRCFGVITMQSPRRHAYCEEDVDVFLTLANYAATALANAQSYDRIRGLLRELQTAQRQLVHAEKMAAFGRVAAGVAHEINNPLAAIRASAESIGRVLEGALASLPALIVALDEQEREALFRLLGRFRNQEERLVLSARERRAKRRGVVAILAELPGDDAERAAELLVDAGVFEVSPNEVRLLSGSNGATALDVAHALGGAVHSVELIRGAVERTTKIVFALKNYARSDRTGEPTIATIAQGVDTVLTLYANAMKAGVELVRRVDETLPPIAAHHDELIQVWTNIVHNSLQAMSYVGTLTVEVVRDGDVQRVSIGDSGTGISDEVLPRIFEPFFTTKTAGEGTGLGLDICRDLVEKHGGTISVETEIGRGTTFYIRIPNVEPS